MSGFWHTVVVALTSWCVASLLFTALHAAAKRPEPVSAPLPKPLDVLMEARAIVWAYGREWVA